MMIKKLPCKKISALFILLLLAKATYADFDIASSPVGDPEISKAELSYRLVPLTKTELTAAANFWLKLLQEHLQSVAENQIKISNADEDNKLELLEYQNKLLEKQTQLIDKKKLVINELQKKGGDSKEYQTFIAAVSNPKVVVTDPDSSAIVATFNEWLNSPDGGHRWAVNIGLFLITLLVFKFLADIISYITKNTVARLENTSDLLKHFFVNLARNLTKVIGIMIALSMLEVNIAPLVAALGAMGFIVGFALQGTLSNFASGLMILIYRPYDIGDVVNVSGTIGTVASMTLVSTTLILPDNQKVIIPNNAIWGTTITNINGNETRRVDMIFGIGYNEDINKAEKVLLEILQQHPLVLDAPEPVIKVHELADSSVNFVVRPWVNTADYFTVYWDVTRSVKEKFDEANIAIPYPQQELRVHTLS